MVNTSVMPTTVEKEEMRLPEVFTNALFNTLRKSVTTKKRKGAAYCAPLPQPLSTKCERVR